MLRVLTQLTGLFQQAANDKHPLESSWRFAERPPHAAFDVVSKDQKKESFDHLPDALVVIDENATIRYVNNQFPEIFGYARSVAS